MQKIKLDDKEYDVANLSERARKLTVELQTVTALIQEANNMIAILTKAKRAYIEGLKSEMLSAKAGFDFESF
jgi:prefoldin subunit 5